MKNIKALSLLAAALLIGSSAFAQESPSTVGKCVTPTGKFLTSVITSVVRQKILDDITPANTSIKRLKVTIGRAPSSSITVVDTAAFPLSGIELYAASTTTSTTVSTTTSTTVSAATTTTSVPPTLPAYNKNLRLTTDATLETASCTVVYPIKITTTITSNTKTTTKKFTGSVKVKGIVG